MPSKHANIWKALKTHLEDYPYRPDMIAYAGNSFIPPSSTEPYWIVDDLRFEPVRMYQGTAASNWHEGSLMVHVMAVIEWSDLAKAEYAGALCDYFHQDTTMFYGGSRVRVSSQPYVSQAGYRDGDHFRMPVNIRWEGWG